MKRFLVTALLLAVSTTATANYGCGIRPIPPIGCTGTWPTCVCDEDGNCVWVFIGCG